MGRPRLGPTALAASASSLGLAAQGVSRLGVNVWMGRTVGPEVLGQVTTLAAVSYGASLLGPAAVGAAASKFVALAQGGGDPDAAEQSLVALVRMGTVMAGLLAGVAAVWAWMNPLGASPAERAAVVALLTFSASRYAVARSVCFVLSRSVFGATVEIGGAVVSLGITGVLIALHLPGPTVLLPQAATLFLYSELLLPHQWAGGRLSREMVEFIVLCCIGNVAGAGVLQGAVLVAHQDGGPAAAGLVSAALGLCTPLTFVASAINSALYPAISRSLGANRGESARLSADKASIVILAVLTPILLAVSVAAPLLVKSVWGQAFDAAASLVPIIAAALLATAANAPQVGLMTASSRGGMREATFASVGGTVGGTVCWIIAMLTPGPQPSLVTWGYFCCQVLTVVVVLVRSGRRARTLMGLLLCGTAAVLIIPLAASQVSTWHAGGGRVIYVAALAVIVSGALLVVGRKLPVRLRKGSRP